MKIGLFEFKIASYPIYQAEFVNSMFDVGRSMLIVRLWRIRRSSFSNPEPKVNKMKPKPGIMKFVVNILVLVAVTVFTARAGAKDADAPLSVYVVNYPLQYFADSPLS